MPTPNLQPPLPIPANEGYKHCKEAAQAQWVLYTPARSAQHPLPCESKVWVLVPHLCISNAVDTVQRCCCSREYVICHQVQPQSGGDRMTLDPAALHDDDSVPPPSWRKRLFAIFMNACSPKADHRFHDHKERLFAGLSRDQGVAEVAEIGEEGCWVEVA